MTETIKNQFDMQITSSKIRKRREELNLSQQQLAEIAGISSESVSRYERANYRIPKIDILGVLADALQCEPDYLLGRIKHPQRSTSEISELIPLSRKAIESLEYLKQTESYHAIMATALLNSIIIGIADSVKEYNDRETILSDAEQMEVIFEQIADYEATGSDFNPNPKLNGWTRNISLTAITGLSFKIGNYLSELVKEAIKSQADPNKHIQSEV